MKADEIASHVSVFSSWGVLRIALVKITKSAVLLIVTNA